MGELFLDIGLVIIASSAVGVLAFYLKQPLILAYIIAGFLIGPVGFGLVHDVHVIESLSAFGIMLMLFLVGLEMNPARLKELGKVAIVAGLGQMIFTGLFGYFMVRFFGSMIKMIPMLSMHSWR
jgi:Kef-type K+ transport system membrane component KefB